MRLPGQVEIVGELPAPVSRLSSSTRRTACRCRSDRTALTPSSCSPRPVRTGDGAQEFTLPDRS